MDHNDLKINTIKQLEMEMRLKKSELIDLLQSKIGLTLPLSNSKTLVELQTIAANHAISIKIKEDVII